ncbi:MAG: VanZ family protein [Acidobacteria bacterium]|nr:VanZ family protein [Acidobacteriota bacterium]
MVFSSSRERRLWTWTLVVAVAIFAGIGLARALVGWASETGILGLFYGVGLFLVVGTIVTQGLEVRPRGAELAIGLGVAAVYLLVMTRMTVPADRTHLIEYSVLAVFIHEALAERASRGRRIRMTPLTAVLAAATLGLIDESLQALIPGRVFDPFDLLFNLLAATLAVSAVVFLRWARAGARRRARARARQ